jgi:signal transduction histidine kinase
MVQSLRGRLILTHVFVILLTLCVVAAALMLLLLNNPLPSRNTYQNLATIARTSAAFLRDTPDQIDRRLAYLDEVNDIRALRLSEEAVVEYDSQGLLRPGASIDLRQIQVTADDAQRGTYRDASGRLWLFVAFPLNGGETDGDLIVLAAPRPRAQLLNLFGDNLVRPLIQAGLIGLALAIVFAVIVSNSVARPLRRVSEAANAIRAGDTDQRAPVAGPHEVQDLAHAFNGMVDQVQRSQQTLKDFLANVSHELKTPLTSIQGYSQAIVDGAAADQTHAAQVIFDESVRMHRMVDDLLDLARIESGQTPLRRERVEPDAVLDTVLANLALRASQKGITLVRELGEMPPITGDGDRLAQVFTNLVDNAIKHTPDEGQIVVRSAVQYGGIQVDITDSGPGIPQDELARVFERFYQIDKSRARGEKTGTGLGLAISREIVEAHGGRIAASSTPGQGATFTVWLPLPGSADETLARRTSRRPG